MVYTGAAMFLKFTESKVRRYVQLVEAFRDDTGHPRQRTVATLGRLEPPTRAMVFNRLCDADSKLGVLRWLKTVSMPGLQAEDLTHEQLLSAMDALMDHREVVDACVAGLLRPLIDQDLSLVFYDLSRAERVISTC